MIDYLTHPKIVDFQPSALPSAHGGGGGIHVKTYYVLDALKEIYPLTRGITDTNQIEADTVLVEPMRFALPIMDGDSNRDHETHETLLAGLKNHTGRVVLYCSELSMLRMSHALRNQLVRVSDLITASCEFQANLFRYVGIHSNHYVRDPMPDLFYSDIDYSKRKPVVIATGNISWQKNAQQVIEVFKALKGVVERVYIGSASFWYDTSYDPRPQKLQEQLYANCDRVIREMTIGQLAHEFHKSRFGLWVAMHDTTALAVNQMLLSGMLVVSAKHGLAAELPLWTASGVRAQVDAIQKLLNESDEALEEQSRRVTQWTKRNTSYKAFQEQIQTVLKAVW